MSSKPLAAVATALAEFDPGHRQVLVMRGRPGIGKTALVAEAGGMAERAGARVLVGEASLESLHIVLVSL